MQIKCEYCEHYIEETALQCPHCGAPNSHAARSAKGIPRTIEELKAFALEKGLPLEKMRFFIGEDYREPKAFGIYREPDGTVVVYKNKSDGSRVVRYRGTDEAYGVNELYQKMRSEVQLRKPKAEQTAEEKRSNRRFALIFAGAWLAIILIFAALFSLVSFINNSIYNRFGTDNGYYKYNEQYYYNHNESWYVYDGGWSPAAVDSELSSNHESYYEGTRYDNNSGVSDFKDSEYYIVTDSDDWNDSSWDDDDWDWDSSSDWDSGSTDWDSDW